MMPLIRYPLSASRRAPQPGLMLRAAVAGGLGAGAVILGASLGCLAACCSAVRLALLVICMIWFVWSVFRFLR